MYLESTRISKVALTSHLPVDLRNEGIITKEADLSQKPVSQFGFKFVTRLEYL